MAINLISGNSTDVATVDPTSKALRVTTYDTSGNPITPSSSADSAAIVTSLGTDGSSPPSIPGTGVRGWLRSIYDAVLARLGTLGQKNMAGSTPVVIASDQTAITVTGTVVANVGTGTQPVSGTVTANLGTIAGVATETTLSAINTKIPASPSQEHVTAGSPHAVRLSDGTSFYKGTTPADTQPVSGTVTANLGTIGAAATETTLGTRVADATITARLNTLGQKTMANSAPVVIASDQSTLNVTDQHSNATADYDTSAGTQNVTMYGIALPSSGGAVAGGTAAAPVRTDPTGTTTQPVSGTVAVSGSVAVTGPLTDTQLRASPVPISAASLPLPTGAATEATLATRLADSTFTGRINTQGQKTSAASTPVVLASDQSTLPISAASLPLPTGAATEATLATRAADSTITARLNTLGAKTSANSAPVVLASDQATLPVSAASLPLPSGAATETTLAAINTKIPASPSQEHTTAGSPSSVRLTDGTTFYKGTTPADTQPISAAALPLPSGAATETTLASRLADSTFTGRINTLGQKAMAASTPVTLASDQSALPITAASLPLPAGAATETTLATKLSLADLRSGTSTNSSVAASATSVSLLSSNANRKGGSIYNDSASANLYILYGATASLTAFRTMLPPGFRHQIESGYTGVVSGIWSAAVGNARCNEET